MILSGTPPEHWAKNCEDFTGYFSWTNVSYVTNEITNTSDENSSNSTDNDFHVEITTGDDQIDKLLKAAVGEIGYKEGGNDDTKFGSWYGANNHPWCAMFVSWAAKDTGLLGKVIPRYSSCSVGVNWYKTNGRYYSAQSNYEPKAGDVFFLPGENGGENASSHTGLVQAYKDGYIYTVEGNYNKKVQCVRRAVSSLKGFGSNGGKSFGTVPTNYV